MSYLHCPTCRCAYNVATAPACPACGIRAGAPADPTEAVVAAAEQLAKAVARATAQQLAAAQAELAMRDAQKALPAPGAIASAPTSINLRAASGAAARPDSSGLAILRAVRAALAPPPPPAPHVVSSGRAHTALLTGVVIALLTRIPAIGRSAKPLQRLLARHQLA